jgi:hypothetical protein
MPNPFRILDVPGASSYQLHRIPEIANLDPPPRSHLSSVTAGNPGEASFWAVFAPVETRVVYLEQMPRASQQNYSAEIL